MNSPNLWPCSDNDSFYNFGGIPSATAYTGDMPINVWKYTPQSGTYVSIPNIGSTSSPSLSGVRPANGLSAHGNGVGYLLGGYNGVPPQYPPVTPVPGLLTYNLTENAWTNESALGYSTYGTALNGRMHFLSSYGQSGLLVVLGGEIMGLGPWHETGNNLVPFTNISFFDTARKTWYWQAATGAGGPEDIPPPSVMFCSAVTTSTSSGTTEIFIYGGHNDGFVLESPDPEPTTAQLAQQSIFDTVYVLSIPGFVWFKTNATAQPRTGHTCEAIGNRHMISIGGLNPTVPWGYAVNQSDPWNQTLGVFDMVDLDWTGSYDPYAPPYVPSQVVSDWYAKP